MHCVVEWRAKRMVRQDLLIKKMSLALYRDLASLLMKVGLRPLRVFEIVFGVVES